MNTNPEVDAWFADFEHPLKDAMLRVREIILSADSRMEETVKWSTPTFTFDGNMASFQPRSKKFVSLMFHRGSDVPGDHAILEGDARLVRTARFEDLADVEAHREELEAVARAWCDRNAAG